MPTDSKKQILKQIRERRYLNKDFDALRNDLLDYARTYFPNRINDFSEASLGGMLLDLAAYVGDVQSYYLDHQFLETFPETASEFNNIQRHLQNAGVKITGAAPASVNVRFFVRIPVSDNQGTLNEFALPIIKQNTVVRANNGTEFILTEDLDFNARFPDNRLKANVQVGNVNANNIPQNYILTLDGLCISGKLATQFATVTSFIPYRKIALNNNDVTEIISVKDTLGNTYYEVDNLTQDTIYRRVANVGYDFNLIPETMVPIPAPYRFISQTDLQTRITSLVFGGGNAQTVNDDVIPDPSEFALPLYGKQTFSRFEINPNNLLQTTTFGVMAENTDLEIIYRYGGGLSHNVEAGTVNAITSLNIFFPRFPSANVAGYVRNSLAVNNPSRASGGESAPDINSLKSKIPTFRSMQNRIVTKEDLLARVYSLPSNFGRVYRAGIRTNPNNPLATQLFIISRNTSNQLIVSPDTLKKNLVTYLNQYRMISDAIDILDARVLNLKITFSIVVDPTENRELVLRNCLQNVKQYFDIKNFDIDQPLIISDIQNIIYNSKGVISLVSLDITNIYGASDNRFYSNEVFDIVSNTYRGIVFGSPGSIFEVRYKDYDIVGTVV
jgi:hypothetical protein